MTVVFEMFLSALPGEGEERGVVLLLLPTAKEASRTRMSHPQSGVCM